MIPLMRIEFIEQQEWLTVEQFLDIMAISEITPGPIAVNTATFIGFQVAGIWGSVLATAGVISPSVIILLLIIYLSKKIPYFSSKEAILKGIKPAVIALIGLAALYLGETVLQDALTVIFFLGFLGLSLFTRISPVLLILIAGSVSLILTEVLAFV